MFFRNNLIKLRKENNYSQEELANLLNLPKEKIQNWENGKSKPTKKEIKKIAKVFNIKKNEIIEKNSQKREKIILSIILIILIISVSLIFYILISKYKELKKNKDENNIFNDLNNNIKENFDYSILEMRKGTNIGIFTKDVLDNIISINNKNEKDKIIIIFNDKEYVEDNEIESLKEKLDDNKNYNIKYEYKEKKIIKAIIKREITKFEINSFNSSFETLYNGTIASLHLKNMFDKIININIKNENKITIIFNEIKTSDPKKIKELKKQIGDFLEYEVNFEYGEEGFINKAIIERVK